MIANCIITYETNSPKIVSRQIWLILTFNYFLFTQNHSYSVNPNTVTVLRQRQYTSEKQRKHNNIQYEGKKIKLILTRIAD